MMLSENMVSFLGLLTREVRRVLKIPYQTLLTPLVSIILYLLIFGISIGEYIDNFETTYLEFLLPGLITLGLVRNSFENTTGSIIASKYTNELQDLRIAPLSKLQITWALSIAALSRALVIAIFTYFIGQLIIYTNYHKLLPTMHPLYMLYMMIVTGLIFSKLGIFIGIISRAFEQVGLISSFILTPLVYLGGVFFSFKKMAPIWQTLTKCNPLFYLIDGTRYSFLGISEVSPVYSFFISLAMLIILHVLCLYSLSKGENYYR